MRTLLLGTLLVLVGCGAGSKSSSTSATKPVNGSAKFYVYGDQIALSGFANQLALGKGLNVVQKAVAGSLITSATQYQALMTDTWEPGSVVLWHFGLNDALTHDPSTDAVYWNDAKTKVQAVFVRLHNLGVHSILVLSTKYCDFFEVGNTYAAQDFAIGQANTILLTAINSVSAFAEPNIITLQLSTAFTPSPANTLDCVLPNATGVTLMTTGLLTQWATYCSGVAGCFQ